MWVARVVGFWGFWGFWGFMESLRFKVIWGFWSPGIHGLPGLEVICGFWGPGLHGVPETGGCLIVES